MQGRREPEEEGCIRPNASDSQMYFSMLQEDLPKVVVDPWNFRKANNCGWNHKPVGPEDEWSSGSGRDGSATLRVVSVLAAQSPHVVRQVSPEEASSASPEPQQWRNRPHPSLPNKKPEVSQEPSKASRGGWAAKTRDGPKLCSPARLHALVHLIRL